MPRWVAWMGLVLGIGLMQSAQRAEALIANAIPLAGVLSESSHIFIVKVDGIDPVKPGMVLVVDENLKDKVDFKKMPVNLTGDAEAKKLNHRDELLKRLAKGMPVVIFAVKKDTEYTAFAYTNGTWFQMTGDGERWLFTHCEPALRGTFKGTTAEIKQVIIDGLAGKKAPPPPNTKEKPGFGPEVEQKGSGTGSARTGNTRGPALAVIPTVVVGGPLLLLAMLFPAVFGGLLLILRRWMAVLTVASINSLLYPAFFFFQDFLPLAWQTPMTLWVAMLIVTLIGALWAWHRHLSAVRAEAQLSASVSTTSHGIIPFFTTAKDSEQTVASTETEHQPPLPAFKPVPITANMLVLADSPRYGEHIVLWVLNALGLVGFFVCLMMKQSLLEQPWLTLLVGWIGLFCGTVYTAYLRLTPGWARSRVSLPIEGVMLSVMVFAGLGFAGTMTGPTTTAGFKTYNEEASDEHFVRPQGLAWKFQAVDKGFIASSPLVVEDRIYVATANQSVFNPSGTLYCLGRIVDEAKNTEEWKIVWRFNNGGKMKQVFCTPLLVDGKLFIGEGFHQDSNCKMYCLNPTTGQKIWEFETASHTESTPSYVNGKIYFGAGDDGLYCVDAETGKEVWHYQNQLHIDANPVHSDGKIYCSSGVGDIFKNTAIFCLDAASGKELWLHPTDLPVWGMPAADGGFVYFGMGNEGYAPGDVSRPLGALLCVDAKTGNRIWRFDTQGSIVCRPALDSRFVYFGSRDGYLYCLEREDGRMRWKWKDETESPMLATPVLTQWTATGCPPSLFALSGDGLLVCLDPWTGSPRWSADMIQASGIKISQSLPQQFYSSPTVVQQKTKHGEKRRIYFGSGIANDFGYNAILFCFEDVQQ